MALRVAVALVLVAFVAGCGSGKPHFERAAGWHLLSGHGELVAANVPFAAGDRSLASPPSGTVATLPRAGIVIWAMYLRDRKSDFPERRLPLRIEQAARSNPFEGFRCAPAVTTTGCYAASGSIWHLEARDDRYALDLYVFFGSDRPLPEDVAAADAELARLRLPHARTTPAPEVVSCPRPSGTDYYAPRVSPESGPAGTTLTVSGRLPVLSESGQDVGQTATEVVAYWNLDFDHWTSLADRAPLAAVPGSPVKLVGTQNVATRCTYHVRVRVPSASTGTYPLEVLYGDPQGSASFAPVDFRVTRG
jgi:hypothetical protein